MNNALCPPNNPNTLHCDLAGHFPFALETLLKNRARKQTNQRQNKRNLYSWRPLTRVTSGKTCKGSFVCFLEYHGFLKAMENGQRTRSGTL